MTNYLRASRFEFDRVSELLCQAHQHIGYRPNEEIKEKINLALERIDRITQQPSLDEDIQECIDWGCKSLDKYYNKRAIVEYDSKQALKKAHQHDQKKEEST